VHTAALKGYWTPFSIIDTIPACAGIYNDIGDYPKAKVYYNTYNPQFKGNDKTRREK
jgi:hypothetical protein